MAKKRFVPIDRTGKPLAKSTRSRLIRLDATRRYSADEVEQFIAKGLRTAGADPSTVAKTTRLDIPDAARQTELERDMRAQVEDGPQIASADGAVLFERDGRETGRATRDMVRKRRGRVSMANVVNASATEPYRPRRRRGR
jgi:hypothetical protein